MPCLFIISILNGCSDNIETQDKEFSEILLQLNASYPTATRASDAGFEDGDAMGIYVLDYDRETVQDINGEDVNAANVKFKFNGQDNSWTGATNVYWHSPNTPADIIAYYPYSSNVSTPSEFYFSINEHQETSGTDAYLGGYESSDFLWGIARKQMPTTDKVQLTLKHLMAGVRVSLKEGTGFTAGEWESMPKNVAIQNTIPSGTINLSDGSTNVGNASKESVIPMEYNGDFRAVVFPQTIDAGNSLMAITVGNDGYNLTKQESMTYVSGKMHTFTITIDKRSDGSLVFTLSDEGIIQWIDDAEFRDGIIRSYSMVNVVQRGTLKETIIKSGLNYKDLTNLKLSGEIDERDFEFMRDEMLSLKSLNLKDAQVYDGERKDVIPAKAMYNKTTLYRIIFPKNLRIIGSDAFHRTGLMGDLIIPEGVEKIGEAFDDDSAFFVRDDGNGNSGAFSYCQNLLGNLELPSTLTHIEHGAFNQCEFEGSLTLPESLEFIGNYTFNRNNFTGSLNLPSSLKYIGEGAFARTKFTGSIEIPEGVKTIYKNVFQGASFSGTLLLPNGIREIQEYAFDGCQITGELLLPSSVLTLGNYAFRNTRISNIVFPNDLTSIGKGCFMDCSHLSGKLIIPDNVTRINEYTFAGIKLLSEIELHENVTYIGGGAFAGDYNLTEIKSLNPVPPSTGTVIENEGGFTSSGTPIGLVEKNPFHEIPLSNVVLKIPDEARDAYTRAEVWKNIGRHVADNGFECRPTKICALNKTHNESLIIDGTGDWEVSHIPSWCKLSQNSGSGKVQVTITVEGQPQGNGNRDDYIEFKIKGTDYTARCNVVQMDYQYDEDECITLQKSTHGKGIDVLFLADGFDAESIANNEYMNLVNEQMDAFFGIEPYTTYQEYFNVYACISISQEIGVSTTNTQKNTKFSTRYDNGTGCSIKSLACDDPDYVFDYAVAHSPLTHEKMNQSLIIMALNSDQYGSVTFLTESGSAIAIVGRSNDPYPWDTRGMLQHEACGHAFGKLAEERITQNKYIDDKGKQSIQDGFWRGWYQNISLTGKINDVHWSHLIFDPRYSDKVDVFEGGYGFTRGVYRAEINSCMNYGIPYFSAPARMDIMKRILEYSGEEFTMEKFYATDSDKWGSTDNSTRAAMPGEDMQYVNSGLHHPVRIIKSKKY